MIARSTLILIGYLKGPIIHTFERYGEQETLYLPLVPLVFWAGLLAFTLGTWAVSYMNLSYPLVGLGFLSMLFAAFSFQNYEITVKWHYRFFRLPQWYHELRERTTRYERRRIAYAWLRMPWRARLTYNSDDRAFFIWADFIIMGTVLDEEDEALRPVP
ncbi:MAG: hypothetical protein HZC41_20275 [Chloroflexi bacterium]|nr:hypothetical protein [Chloroflexota bacterium]